MLEIDGKPYYSLGEASKLTQLSFKALRYYDAKGIVVPSWRNPDNGYRYYDLDQIYNLWIRKTASSLGLLEENYREHLIMPEPLDKSKLLEVLGYLRNMKHEKQNEVIKIESQIEQLDLMADEMMLILGNDIPSAMFTYYYESTDIGIFSLKDVEQRNRHEPLFYEALAAITPHFECRFGRVFDPVRILNRQPFVKGYLCKMRENAPYHFLKDVSKDFSFIRIPAGSYDSFLVRDIYNMDIWDRLLESDSPLANHLTHEVALIAAECGVYNSYDDFSEIIHLVRVVPRSNIEQL